MNQKRLSKTNSLGQLTDVWEITSASGSVAVDFGEQSLSGYLTQYQYDVLNDLTKVTQGTQTPRIFTYSSLKQLTAATNPESGTISYQYNNNGNLTQKTDARDPAVATTYIYDKLNRVTNRSYSDGTPAVTYAYDDAEVANSKGRVTSESSSVSSYSYSYDALGRPLGGKQTTGGQDYMMSYGYDRAGNMTLAQVVINTSRESIRVS